MGLKLSTFLFELYYYYAVNNFLKEPNLFIVFADDTLIIIKE